MANANPQQSPLVTKVGMLLSKFGQDPSGASAVVNNIKALNPGISDQQILSNIGKNFVTLLQASKGQKKGYADGGTVDDPTQVIPADSPSVPVASAPVPTPTPGGSTQNITSTINPTSQQDAQTALNAERDAAAAEVQRRADFTPITNFNMHGNTQAVDQFNQAPLAGVNVKQASINAQAAARQSDLDAIGKDFDNQKSKFAAQAEAEAAKQAGFKSTTEGLAAKRNQDWNDPQSATSQTYAMSALPTITNLLHNQGQSDQQISVIVGKIPGMSGAQIQQILDPLLAGNKNAAEIKEAVARAASSLAQAHLLNAQTPGASAESDIAVNARNNAGVLPGGGNASQPNTPATTDNSSGGTTQDDGSISGNTNVNSVTGQPEKKALPSKFNQYQSTPALNSMNATSGTQQELSAESVARAQQLNALQHIQDIIESVSGPTGYNSSMQETLAKLDGGQRNELDKWTAQLNSANPAGARSDAALGTASSGLPDYRKMQTGAYVKTIRSVIGNVQKKDRTADSLNESANKGNIHGSSPGTDFGNMKSFALVDKNGKTVDQATFGSSSAERMKLKKWLENGTKNGLRPESTDGQ